MIKSGFYRQCVLTNCLLFKKSYFGYQIETELDP
jgi:hypothetical protein